MAKLNDVQRAFIRDNPFYAVLTTLRPTVRRIRPSIWVDEDDGDLVFNTARGRAKERHLARRRARLDRVVDPADPYRWLAVSGTVTMTDRAEATPVSTRSRAGTPGADYAWHRAGR